MNILSIETQMNTNCFLWNLICLGQIKLQALDPTSALMLWPHLFHKYVFYFHKKFTLMIFPQCWEINNLSSYLAPSNKYGMGMCDNPCPSNCNPTDMMCPQGEDYMGCKQPDMCFPAPGKIETSRVTYVTASKVLTIEATQGLMPDRSKSFSP